MKASCKNEIACYQHYGDGSQNIREENVYINIITKKFVFREDKRYIYFAGRDWKVYLFCWERLKR